MAEDAATPELHWVDPEIRGVMPLDRFHIAKSLRKSLRHKSYSVKIDSAFADVIAACAERTRNRPTTWINHRLLTLYTELHRLGHAHSVECWENGQLVGGLYGVRLGAAFFGESMFSRRTDASKIALVHLVARLRTGHFTLLDAQFSNPHLEQFGVDQIPKDRYQRLLARAVEAEADFTLFNADDDPEKVLRAAGA